ncbi:MAG: polysaccharide deacetylase family protein [Candidatus Sumerlaeota bacterium]|nr:polysaccharide deacetylase family protein [Candidatus Sumerlaeota bacterium]
MPGLGAKRSLLVGAGVAVPAIGLVILATLGASSKSGDDGQAPPPGSPVASAPGATASAPTFTPHPPRGSESTRTPAPSLESIPKPTPDARTPRGVMPLPAFPEGGAASKPTYTPHPPRAKEKPSAEAQAETVRYAAASSQSAGSSSSARRNEVSSGSSKGQCVALTFDDGPNPKYTPILLKYLRENDVPATFFLLGKECESETAKTLMIEMAEYGFEIGNHSWSHPDDLAHADRSKILAQIQNTADVIESVTGKRPTLFRPPYGLIGKTMRDLCEELGVTIVLWSVDTEDWRDGMTADKIVANVEKELHGGSIILMHDRLQRTTDAVPRVVELVRSKGYRLSTVSELIYEMRGGIPTPPAASAPASAPAASAPAP